MNVLWSLWLSCFGVLTWRLETWNPWCYVACCPAEQQLNDRYCDRLRSFALGLSPGQNTQCHNYWRSYQVNKKLNASFPSYFISPAAILPRTALVQRKMKCYVWCGLWWLCCVRGASPERIRMSKTLTRVCKVCKSFSKLPFRLFHPTVLVREQVLYCSHIG